MILVIGGGVAGLSCALAAVRAGAEVELVTQCGHPTASNTVLAQGGIAAAVAPADRAADHAADTIAAGAGLVDPEAAAVLASDGARLVRGMLAAGFPADRATDGGVEFGLEAAHGRPRIVHAGGDRTGAVLHAWLGARLTEALRSGLLRVTALHRVASLVMDSGAVAGAVLERDSCDADAGADAGAGARVTRFANAVVLATGGYGALYPRTSNHTGATGGGIVVAAQAGALVADLEFVQFHPTLLGGNGDSDPGFLVSEAVRGAGAVLRDGSGRRFMHHHPAAELAPRDVVSREIHRVLKDRGESEVWLDATSVEQREGNGYLARTFPSIHAAVVARGFDWTRDPIPVAPAAHYTMGGVATDLHGRSSLPGLFVIGEAASTGVHGANRLASNSLLEGLVFGERAGLAAALPSADWETQGSGFAALVSEADVYAVNSVGLADERGAAPSGAMNAQPNAPTNAQPSAATNATLSAATNATPRKEVARLLADGFGIERQGEAMRSAAASLARVPGPESALAAMIAVAAMRRTESRGAHQHADFPAADLSHGVRRASRVLLPAAVAAAPERLHFEPAGHSGTAPLCDPHHHPEPHPGA